MNLQDNKIKDAEVLEWNPEAAKIAKEKKAMRKSDLKATAESLKSDFIKGIQESQKKFQQEMDTEFFFCVAFQNREQKEAFLKQTNLIQHGDKYLNGLKVAKTLGVNLEIQEKMRDKFKFKNNFAGKLIGTQSIEPFTI